MSCNSQPCEIRSPMLPPERTEQLLNAHSHKKSLKPDDLPRETGHVRDVVAVFNSNDRGRQPAALYTRSPANVCTNPPYRNDYGSKSNSAVSVETQTENLSIDQEIEHQRCCGCNLSELEEKIQEQGRQIKEALEQTVAPLIVEVGSIQQTSGFEWKQKFVNMFEKQSEQLDKNNKSISDLLDITAQLREVQNQRLEELEKSFSTKTQWLEEKFLEVERLRHEDAKVMREDQAELKNTVTVLMSERSHHTVIGSAQPDCVHAPQQCAEELHTSKHQKGSSDKQTGSLWNSVFGSSNQHLKEENESLRQKVKNSTAQLQRLQTEYESKINRLTKELEEAKKNSKRSKEALMKFKTQTEGEWTGSETPSSVSQKFGLLFGTVRNSSADTTLKASSGRELANDIFKVAYEECQTAVLKELFTELFCHHEPGHHEEISRADSQKRVYGMLLGLRKEPPQVTLDRDFLTEEVLKKVLRVDHGTDVPCVKSNTKYEFTKNAVETALDMVSMQPPMIIDYPEKLVSEDIQEKQFTQWDDSLQKGEYELRYLRPVLYSSYREQEYLQKAHVGNKRVIDANKVRSHH